MTTPAFLPLTGHYEPSAIQQLADGRFLVLEDEKQYPFSVFSLSADGRVVRSPLNAPPDDPQGAAESLGKLDDLEGVTLDRAGNLYAITSHSRTADGDEKKGREKLVRFRIDGDRVLAAQVFKGLKPALAAAYPALAAAAAVRDPKTPGGLNIEGLEMSPDEQLLIGFRSPQIDGRAVIARLENPQAVFDAGAAPRLSAALITLNLEGDGFRSLSYVASLGGFLIISGPASRETTQFKLWFWAGQPTDAPRRVTVSGLPGFGNGEGICPAIIDGQPKIIIVSDDGDREEGRCARYLLLDPGQLQVAMG